jgi:hypothetical protein
MRLMQLVYTSRPFGFDDLELRNILLVSRHNNERDGITGSLICREDIYLQLLEGPRAAVSSAYTRIARDNRHGEVMLLWAGDVQERLFPQWFMRHDPVQSWMWTPQQVRAGAVAEAPMEDIRSIFVRLAASPNEAGA